MIRARSFAFSRGCRHIATSISSSSTGCLTIRYYTAIAIPGRLNERCLGVTGGHSTPVTPVFSRSFSTKNGDKSPKSQENLEDSGPYGEEDESLAVESSLAEPAELREEDNHRLLDSTCAKNLVKKPDGVYEVVTKTKQRFGRQAQSGKIRRKPIPLENREDDNDVPDQARFQSLVPPRPLLKDKSDSDNTDDNNNDDENTPVVESDGSKSEELISTQFTLPIIHFSNSKRVHALPALGLYRKPAFPGFYQVLQIQDQSVIKCLSSVKQNSGHDYIGGFLTKTDPSATTNVSVDKESSNIPVLRDDAGVVKSYNELHIYGTLLQIITITPNLNFQGGQVILMPHKRIKMTGIHSEPSENNPLFRVAVEYVEDTPKHFEDSSITKALHLEIISTVKELIKTSNFYKEHFDQIIRFYNLDYPTRLADLIAGISLAKRDQLQSILAELNIDKRLTMVLEIAKNDLEFARIQNDVNLQLEEKLSKDQRKYILTEQMKMIKKELGIDLDDKTNIIEQFEAMYNNVKEFMSDESKVSFTSGINRLKHLESSSAEFGVWRSYLEWLMYLPWGKYTVESKDIHRAKEVLDSHHFGLNDVKTRILEFMATNILKSNIKESEARASKVSDSAESSTSADGSPKPGEGGSGKEGKSDYGKIICLIGPPGVGKTSIAIAMAESLNRKLYRFSLGGLFDIAEIKGHRRTYVGSLPGKFVQALKYTNTLNPLIILDEIDKLGRDTRGDPASALLEALDPSQNMNFRDYYLDIPIDLSQVLFVCTANSTDTIPAPLLDRMEMINIPGYLPEEKVMICKHFLIPSAMKSTGLNEDLITIEDSAIDRIIKQYSREAGVRNLLKCVEKIHRKVALSIVMSSSKKGETSVEGLGKGPDGVVGAIEFVSDASTTPSEVDTSFDETVKTCGGELGASHEGDSVDGKARTKTVVHEEDVINYLGVPIYNKETLHPYPLPYGVVMGLAWTNSGGATMYVEAHGQMLDKYGSLIEPNRNDGLPTSASDKSVHGSQGESSSTDPENDRRELKGKGSLKVTGHLGNVMTESAQIALTYCKTFIRKHQPHNIFLDEADIHIHVPEGATPKDGPSGGITMACALISLAAKKRIKPSLAMTGELTISGKILRVGGIKEKLIAAIREDVTTVIMPMGNKPDFDELDASIKDKVQILFVDVFDDVYENAFE